MIENRTNRVQIKYLPRNYECVWYNCKMKTNASELAVQSWLFRQGVLSHPTGYNAPFDLYTPNGTRIEVKTAQLCKHGTNETWQWSFNIHRHGSVDNSQVDVYVLRLESNEVLKMYGFSYAIHMIIPAPIHELTVNISPRSLLNQAEKWATYVDNISVINRLDETYKQIGQDKFPIKKAPQLRSEFP